MTVAHIIIFDVFVDKPKHVIYFKILVKLFAVFLFHLLNSFYI